MTQLMIKTLLSAIILVAASEVSKRSTLLGALIIALPLNSIMAMSWLYLDTRDSQRVAQLSHSIMLLILPTLVFFIIVPVSLKAGQTFGTTLILASAVTVLSCWLWSALLARFGILL
jgi:F0F1-type ATP synthase assembly protein I